MKEKCCPAASPHINFLKHLWAFESNMDFVRWKWRKMKPSSVSAPWPCPWTLSKSNTVRTPQCKNCLGKPLRNAKLTSSTTDTPPQRPDETKMEPEASGNRKSKTSQCTIAQTTKCNRTNYNVHFFEKVQLVRFHKTTWKCIQMQHVRLHKQQSAIAQTTMCICLCARTTLCDLCPGPGSNM